MRSCLLVVVVVAVPATGARQQHLTLNQGVSGGPAPAAPTAAVYLCAGAHRQPLQDCHYPRHTVVQSVSASGPKGTALDTTVGILVALSGLRIALESHAFWCLRLHKP